MVGNFGSLLTVIEALDNPITRLIGKATASQLADRSARLQG
jgi:hypothetical protein